MLACLLWSATTACGGGNAGGDPVRLEIRPANILLLKGETARMQVVGFDAEGREVKVEATWSSDAPAVVAVDNDGALTAQQVIESTQIHASVGDLSSMAFAYVAEPADGAVLYYDRDVISPPVRVAGAPEDTLVGSQLVLGLANVAPAVGDILIPREETAAMGKVVGVDGDQVTVEVVPINQVFRNLLYHQDLEPVLGNPDDYRIDGQSALGVGPFDCTVDAGVSIPTPMFDRPTIDPIAKWRGRLEIDGFEIKFMRIAAEVGAILNFGGSYEIPAMFSGSMQCEWILWRFPVEGIGGPMSLLARPTLPIGLGFSVSGDIRADLLRFTIKGKSAARAAIGSTIYTGIEWSPETGFESIFEQNDVNDFELAVDVPGLEQGPRFTADGRLYVTSGLDLTPRISFSRNSSLEFIDFDVGLSQTGDFASIPTQADNASYASRYALQGFVRLGVGKDIVKALEAFGIQGSPGMEGTSSPIATSPTGTLGAPGGDVPVGQEVTFTVSLMNTDYLDLIPALSFYNVEFVEIQRKTDTGWELLDQTTAAAGQTEFTFTWTPTNADVGTTVVAPFVTTSLLPIIPLELADDARRTFTVVPAVTDDRIVVVGDSDNGLYSILPDGSDRITLQPPTVYGILTPMVSNSGLNVLYSEESGGTLEIRSLSGGGGSTIAPPGGEFYEEAIWSPTDDRLAFTSTEQPDHIFVMGVGSGTKTRITPAAFNEAFMDTKSLAWSPDGTKIAFKGRFEADLAYHLYVVNADGSGQVRVSGALSFGRLEDPQPQWLPDGRLVFIGDCLIHIVNADGTGLTPINQANGCVEQLAQTMRVSPSGNRIAYRPRGSSAIRAVGTDGMNDAELLAEGAVDSQCIAWSPDGSRIAYNDGATIRLLAVDGSGDAPIYTDPDVFPCVYWTRGLAP